MTDIPFTVYSPNGNSPPWMVYWVANQYIPINKDTKTDDSLTPNDAVDYHDENNSRENN